MGTSSSRDLCLLFLAVEGEKSVRMRARRAIHHSLVRGQNALTNNKRDNQKRSAKNGKTESTYSARPMAGIARSE